MIGIETIPCFLIQQLQILKIPINMFVNDYSYNFFFLEISMFEKNYGLRCKNRNN